MDFRKYYWSLKTLEITENPSKLAVWLSRLHGKGFPPQANAHTPGIIFWGIETQINWENLKNHENAKTRAEK